MFGPFNAVTGQFIGPSSSSFSALPRINGRTGQFEASTVVRPFELTNAFGSTIGRLGCDSAIESEAGVSTGWRLSNRDLVDTFGTQVGRIDPYGVVRDAIGCDMGLRVKRQTPW